MNDLEKLLHYAKPTTLTFDCYGTLVDWEVGAAKALRDIYGYPTELVSENALVDMFLALDAVEIRKNIFPYSDVLKNVADQIAERLLGHADPELSAAFPNSLPTWPVFAEANEALKQLAKHFRLAIISNVDDDLLFGTLQSFDVVFDEVITSQQIQCYKPDAPIFEQAICRLDESPASIIHVAEGLCEARPARKLGMRSIWVKRSVRSDDGSGATPNATSHNLVELVDAAQRTFAA
ncbi:HAD family hydrolase [Pelagibius sp. Alg239-R121]|uniref:HAD family hydrolase n=1 Tax=Pelagibius sp. Alg239-R121 TaxID=2993448 RepID=UPI0024A6350C|nr:HAD family hydrolase [Pelagibius sp. Alg239-R121]